MIPYDEFEQLLTEISKSFPEELYTRLNGGIILIPDINIHPESRSNDLLILGEYCVDHNLGRFIKIYYESFCQIYGHVSLKHLRVKLTEVLKHEFLHHLESMAGEKDLEIQDAIDIAKYRGLL